MLRVIENSSHDPGAVLRAQAWRALRSMGSGAMRAFASAWNRAFPLPDFPSGADEPSPAAKAAALREPALLTERLEATSDNKAG